MALRALALLRAYDKIALVKPRIVFMGTPKFALPTLEKLCDAYPVVGVVTQPDRPAGRGRRYVAPPVKQLAEAEGIPVFQPERLRAIEAIEHVRAWMPDLIVVAAFGQILPAAVLELAHRGALNIHSSLLPRWRGATPVQAALLAGDTVTGVTVMQMDEGLDTGPILAQREIEILENETAGELEERLAQLGAELLLDTLPAYLHGEIQPRPQPQEGVTLTRRLRKESGALDWQQSALALERQIRAFSPEPGAFTLWGEERLKILKAQALPKTAPVAQSAPGTVFRWESMPAVVTGNGALVLLQLQMAGKRPMSGDAFLRGKNAVLGSRLTAPTAG
ncbi:MAG: methionyl-tRNA formyltransferase [Anaerolineae bacterium]|nr:methionyl-tRNA formyltransferase [Anaerolineae bacterium]